MSQFAVAVKKFVKEEDAPTMVEYGLLVAFIALVVVGGAATFGGSLRDTFSSIGTSLGNANTTLPSIP